MKECKLTKKPCRAAIKESVDKCKDQIILREIYQIAELLRKITDDVEQAELSESDYDRAMLICEAIRLDDEDIKKYGIRGKVVETSSREKSTNTANTDSVTGKTSNKMKENIDYKARIMYILEKAEQKEKLEQIYESVKRAYIRK